MDIANTEVQNWKEYQEVRWVKIWWDFGVMNLYFELLCSASVLFNSGELGFDVFAFAQYNAWQRNVKKKLLIPILHMFACLGSIRSKMWIQQQTSCLHLEVSLAWFWCYSGSYLFQKYSSLPSWSLNNICIVAIPGQIIQLESRRAVPQASQPP